MPSLGEIILSSVAKNADVKGTIKFNSSASNLMDGRYPAFHHKGHTSEVPLNLLFISVLHAKIYISPKNQKGRSFVFNPKTFISCISILKLDSVIHMGPSSGRIRVG